MCVSARERQCRALVADGVELAPCAGARVFVFQDQLRFSLYTHRLESLGIGLGGSGYDVLVACATIIHPDSGGDRRCYQIV